MDDLRWKRQAIERGVLQTWSRRGRGRLHAESLGLLCAFLRGALRLTGLRARGEDNARKPLVQNVRLISDRLPEGFCGFTILHLSDLHADGLPGLAESLSAKLGDIEVDLCVLTGDYRFALGGPCAAVYPHLAKILASVKARLGTVGILGNHDVWEEVAELERLGVIVLVNAAMALRRGGDSAWLIGVDDPHYYGCDDLAGAMRGVPPEAFKILLVHTPELVDEAAAAGVDLYLCGHTHGGQICLPWIGPIIVNANCPRRYARGLWRHRHMQGYTSPGVGTSGVPVRFFCPPEIGVIELRCSRHRNCPSPVQTDPAWSWREAAGQLVPAQAHGRRPQRRRANGRSGRPGGGGRGALGRAIHAVSSVCAGKWAPLERAVGARPMHS